MRYLSWNDTASSSVKKTLSFFVSCLCFCVFSGTGLFRLFPVFRLFRICEDDGDLRDPRTVLKKHRGRRGDFTDPVERGFRFFCLFVKCVYVWSDWRAGPADRVRQTPGTSGVSKAPSDSVAKIGILQTEVSAKSTVCLLTMMAVRMLIKPGLQSTIFRFGWVSKYITYVRTRISFEHYR